MRWHFLIAVATLAGAASAQTGAPDVVIRSSSNEVLLDVVVRDAHGRLIKNLKPGDVSVYEDGVRQAVSSFRLVAGSEVRAEDLKQAESLRAPTSPAMARKAERPAVNPLRTVNIVCLVLSDLNADTRAQAFESALQFVNNELRPNTFIGVFSMDSSGLRPVFPFSNNRENLLRAVQLASTNQLPAMNLGSAAMLNGLSMSTIGSITPNGSSSDGTADGSSAANPMGTRGDIGVAIMSGLREIAALRGLVKQMTPLPFQKTVLLISPGITRPPDLLEYWDLLVKDANRGGVSFFALDVNGLRDDVDPMASAGAMLNYAASLSRGQRTSGQSAQLNAPQFGPPPSGTAQLMEMAHEDDIVKFGVSSANGQEALRELAERTGGFLIANTNNTEKLMAHVMEDVDTHYEIAYPPASNNYDGHFRKIEVKLDRPGLRVQTRDGYFAVPETGEGPVTPDEMAALKALDTQPRPQAFDFLLRAYRFRDTGNSAQYAIAFEMPISNLTATAEPDLKSHRLHASLLALVKNAQGQIVDRVSKDVPSEVADDRLAAVQVETMTYEHAVNLPPGRYTVEAAVVDQESNHAATAVTRIDNREQAGLGLSDLTLVRRMEDLKRPLDPGDPFEFPNKRVLPFVTTNLYAGGFPFVYFVVYPEKDNSARTEMRVRFLRNGRPLASRKVTLPPADASGSIPKVIAGSNKPGSYEVRITVTQGKTSVERTLQYAIAGKPVRDRGPIAELPR
ncbi:MAG TPA: VWA domain-containing protein [Bryobacteraceae bacterium]|nr:VWA domain-containing protein [Bryobacteraceae bacterium]